MSSKVSGPGMTALIGVTCLLGGVVSSIILAAIMLQLSGHFFGLWLMLLISFVLILYGLWVLRMAFDRAAWS